MYYDINVVIYTFNALQSPWKISHSSLTDEKKFVLREFKLGLKLYLSCLCRCLTVTSVAFYGTAIYLESTIFHKVCTRFILCCVLLWLDIWIAWIHKDKSYKRIKTKLNKQWSYWIRCNESCVKFFFLTICGCLCQGNHVGIHPHILTLLLQNICLFCSPKLKWRLNVRDRMRWHIVNIQ